MAFSAPTTDLSAGGGGGGNNKKGKGKGAAKGQGKEVAGGCHCTVS
jgi:hypothetical protein